MRTIDLFLIGKYDYKSQSGEWIYYITYRGAVKKESRITNGKSSASRLAIIALLNALNCINTPCNIRIHTKNNMSFNNIKKSINKDLLEKAMNSIINAGHQFTIDNNVEENVILAWEYEYGNKAKKDEEINKIKQQQKLEKKIQQEMDKQLEKQAEQHNQDWRAMYSDLMGPSEGIWRPGSGGY